MATAMRGKEKLSDGKEVLGYEMFCDGCAVLREEGQGLGKAERSGARAQICTEMRSFAMAWISPADLSNAKAWMRGDSISKGVEQIRAEEQRQRNASRGGEARSKGKAKYS